MKRNLFALMAFIFIAFITVMKLSAQETESRQTPAQEDSIKAALGKAQSFFQQGNTEDAFKIYTSIMQNYPDNKEAVQEWVMAKMKTSPVPEAELINVLGDLRKSFPNNTAILYFKTYLEIEHGHNEDALIDCEKLIQLQPDLAENYILKGYAMNVLSRYQEAFEAYDKATSLDQKIYDAWAFKAILLARLGRFDEAIASSNKAMELNPKGFYNRACMYCIKGDKINTLADLKKAIDWNPNFKQGARNDKDFQSLWDDEDFKKLTE